MKSFSVTDIGRKRSINQDYVFCSEHAIGRLPNLFIVADGMGGHNAGDYASKYSVEVVIDYIKNCNETTSISMLDNAIQHANNLIRKKAEEDSSLEGMGTTFVAATISDYRMIVANIGDSRLYVIGDDIRQVTKDHSLVELMVENGELNPEEARVHPNKNIVTRAIGGADDEALVDFFEIDLKEGNIVLLCSDGLSNMLEDKDIFQIVKQYETRLEDAGRALVDKANEQGGKDNIAIILMSV